MQAEVAEEQKEVQVEAEKKAAKTVAPVTTKEPDDGMIECAIRAMELVIPEEKGADAW